MRMELQKYTETAGGDNQNRVFRYDVGQGGTFFRREPLSLLAGRHSQRRAIYPDCDTPVFEPIQ